MSLHPWISKIKDLDNRHVIQRKRVAEAVEEALKANKEPFNSSSRYVNTNTATISNSSTSACNYPPKLTDEKQKLLADHDGCFKCRKFYSGHHANQCATTISRKGYKQLTLQDAQKAKACNAKGAASSSQLKTVANIAEVTPSNDTDDFIAAIFPSLSSGAIGDGSFSEGSDSSFASLSPPPLKSKHFIWNCSLDGPSVTFPVTRPSLIDNGCHMVLIHPNTVKTLGLPLLTLEQPEEVDVAISFSKAGITRDKKSLVHYVELHPSSPDSVFCSHLVYAVVCPGLCMPLIFGLPSLEVNDIICDHKRRTCIVKYKNLNYNLLQPVLRVPPSPPKLKFETNC